MTAAVAPLPMPLQLTDTSADARKRRREIIASQRSLEIAKSVVASLPTLPPILEIPAKRQKLNEAAKPKAKKPQMKYDPDVPMTKDEAASWRREQRRKRNRESAAASRQRQRDRISELEVEVEGWESKFVAIMDKIKQLEEVSGKSADDLVGPFHSLPVAPSKFVSPPSSPRHSPMSTPVSSPVTSSLVIAAAKVTPKEGLDKQIFGQVDMEHSDIMITRPAAS